MIVVNFGTKVKNDTYRKHRDNVNGIWINFPRKRKIPKAGSKCSQWSCKSNQTNIPLPPSVDSTVQFVQDVCSAGWSSSNVLTCATGNQESQNTRLSSFKCREQQELLLLEPMVFRVKIFLSCRWLCYEYFGEICCSFYSKHATQQVPPKHAYGT
jgi:hypothetical protein